MKRKQVNFKMREGSQHSYVDRHTTRKTQAQPSSQSQQPESVQSPLRVVLTLKGMFTRFLRKNAGNLPLVAFAGILAGLVIGLTLAWTVWPVEYTDVPFSVLGQAEKAILVEAAAELNAYDLGNETAQKMLVGWNSSEVACRSAFAVADPDRKVQILYLVYLSGNDCENQERLAQWE